LRQKISQWQNRIDVIGISALLYEALLTFYGKLLFFNDLSKKR